MKWLLFILVLVSATAHGQADDSTKYIWYKYQYGQRMPRIYADSIFRVPIGDTTNVPPHKGSIRIRIAGGDTTIFFGTGLRWKAVGTGTSSGGGSSGDTTYTQKPIIVKSGTSDTLALDYQYGLTIDADSSLVVDTSTITSRTWDQKGKDSLGAIKVNYSDTGTMLSPYLRRGDTTAMLSPYLRKALTSGQIFVGNGSNVATGVSPSGDLSSISTAGAVTIANNAISNAKFRQSAANSLVGRASGSTGNVADIAATISNTYFMFDGSTVKADSVNYGHIKNAPPIFPGMYIAPAQSFNPGFLVIATAIIRPSNSFSLNNPILYEILDNSTGHNYSFIDSAYGHASNARLVIRFPNVKNVLSMVINGDETFVANGLQIGGPSIASTNAEVAFYRPYTMGVTLLGDGTTTWTKVSGKGLTSLFTVDTYNTGNGVTGINIAPNYAADYSALHFQYIGPNGYSLRLATSGLGSFNTGFILQDQFGNAVLTPPTSSDRVVVSNAGSNMEQVGMTLWSTLTNNWMTSSANVWVMGFYEAWMVAAPASSTAIQVRYQTTVPSATSYKIYRSTSLYGAKTLVHTGTTGIFTDGSLTANTMYWYHMYATISGVDTYITYFRTNTYFN